MSTPIKPNRFKPRFSKVISDVWEDKTRTLLVVASIAVGVFAIGMILSAFVIMQSDINLSYASVNPPNIEIFTNPFQQNFARILEKTPGVEDVESSNVLAVRARKTNEDWVNINLIGMVTFPNQINQLSTIQGTQVPGRNEIVITQDFIHDTGYQPGDEIEVELPDGTSHWFTVVGIVIDQTNARPDPGGAANGYITLGTMEAIGLGNQFNRLFITVTGDGSDQAFVDQVSDEVESRIERNNRTVFRIQTSLSTEHPMSDSILAIIGVLGALGGLITILSSSLIINMLNSLLTQQLRQIGVMKLVGGRSTQILGMYVILIIAYSLISLLISIPFGAVAGYGLASLVAFLTGSVLQGFRFVPVAVITQIIIAIVIPLGAGFFPIYRGAKTNVRQALTNDRPRIKIKNWNLFTLSWFSKFSRPILLSFRNTFRKPGRVLLTVFTLTVAGAVFIAVFNVRDSMTTVMNDLMQHFLGDVTITFAKPYSISAIKRDLDNVPGVIGVEGWGGALSNVLDANDEVITPLSITAPPQNTELLDLDFISGRWLLPNEKKALVVSDTIHADFPDLEVGDTLRIEITGTRAEEWEVVGIFRFVEMLGDPIGYANLDYVSDKVNMSNQAISYRLITEAQTEADQRELAGRVDTYLNQRGFSVQNVQAGYVLRESASLGVNTLVIFLLLMAILTAFVGSIGLTGTMSINVLERTREIGVMRTIGAVDKVIMQSVIIESLIIGIITWMIAIVLSFPISSALLTIIGESMMGSPVAMSITPIGTFVWLGIVIVLSIIASIMPARNAARLTINEVLAYE